MVRKRRVPSDLMILSASAVVGVYAVGYVITEPAAGLAQQIAITAATPSAVTTGRLRDGLYLGEGESPFGNVFVTVAVAQGRISQVWINGVTTTFPERMIDGLRGEVVVRQSAAVDIVTGATASTSAFVRAVQAALHQAQS